MFLKKLRSAITMPIFISFFMGGILISVAIKEESFVIGLSGLLNLCIFIRLVAVFNTVQGYLDQGFR